VSTAEDRKGVNKCTFCSLIKLSYIKNKLSKYNIMKAKLFSILFFLSFISVTCYSQTKSGTGSYSGGHDSLLFDGGDANSFNFLKDADDNCKIKVQDVFGDATGTYWVDTIYRVCGVKEPGQIQRTGLLKRGVELVPGYEITTGGEGYKGPRSGHLYNNTLMLDLGPSALMLGRRASVTIGKDCVIHVNSGAVLMSGEHDISTSRTNVSHKKTRYTVEVVEDGDKISDIVKVYEGEVEVFPKKDSLAKITGNLGKEIGQLNLDLVNKKITLEEYKAKMAELNPKLEEYTNNLSKIVKLTAGYQCTVDSKGFVSDPVAIESTGTEWFDESNFEK
jgi:hypothetical protein